MKHKIIHTIILLCLGCAISLSAQELSVTSFRLLENDMTANTYKTTVKDRNGEVSALIKVVTTEQGFVFDGGMVGIVKTVQEAGEIWVYVPHGIKRLSIRHPQLGVLRDYYIPIAVEKARTYEMTLKMPQLATSETTDTRSGLLRIMYQPIGAEVLIDGVSCNPISEGVVSFMLPYGVHTYRVEQKGYVTEEGSFTLNAEQLERTVALRSQIAKLTLLAPFEDGEIFLNGEFMGKGKWTGEILAHDYIAEVRKNGYTTQPDTFTLGVEVDTIISLRATKSPTLTVMTPFADGHIYVNGKYKGLQECTMELPVGKHIIELQRMSASTEVIACETDTVVLTEGETVKLEMTNPIAYMGAFSLTSEPAGCDIYYNGVFVGSTPSALFTDVPMGEHPLLLYKEGYEPLEMMVNIKNGEQTDLSVVLNKADTLHTVARHISRIDSIILEKLTITVNDVDFIMIPVEGGMYDGKELSDFYIAETEVTRELWNAVLGGMSYPYPYNQIPIGGINWYDCQVFIKALNSLTGKHFKMPTQVQWEYAAHGGKETKGYKYSGGNNANLVAWFASNSDGRLEQVKQKRPNELGIYDMSGNVYEWCRDFIPPYPEVGVKRITKGGKANSNLDGLDLDKSVAIHARIRDNFIGLRLVLEE